MNVFINETSLDSQFENPSAFFESLKKFLASIRMVSELQQQRNVFKSSYLFYYSGIKGTYLETTLKANQSLNKAFVTNLQLVNPKTWQNEQVHDSNSSYMHADREYSTTSVAEIAARKIANSKFTGFLLNFDHSQFGSELRIEVVKDGVLSVRVDCNVDDTSIDHWLTANGFYDPAEKYNVDSGVPPIDYQTVLNDTTKFEKTSYPKNNGRTVFRLIGTKQLWVVDGAKKHAGEKAHIEIFDEVSREHLGTSLYNEVNLNTLFKKPNRFIRLG